MLFYCPLMTHHVTVPLWQPRVFWEGIQQGHKHLSHSSNNYNLWVLNSHMKKYFIGTLFGNCKYLDYEFFDINQHQCTAFSNSKCSS